MATSNELINHRNDRHRPHRCLGPFCFLAQPLLARIEAVFEGQLEIQSRAFELRPDPEPTLDPDGDYLHAIWARSVYPMALERGIRLHLPPVQPRSRLAHELVAFAHTRNKGVELHHALFEAFFGRGEDIGDVDILAQLAVNADLDEDAVRRVFAEGLYRPQVLADIVRKFSPTRNWPENFKSAAFPRLPSAPRTLPSRRR